jgi:23S rRNA (uridine2552-2'-O)-methyltransferase
MPRLNKRWLHAHKRDQFFNLAAQEGMRSRSVYKLSEIDQKFNLLVPGMKVLDLGSSPGGWSQYAASKLGKSGKVFAVDMQDMKPIKNVHFLQGNVTDNAIYRKIQEEMPKIDLVLSDMAPNISGIPSVDQPKSIFLVELAIDLAANILVQSGSMLVKIFHGDGFEETVARAKLIFNKVRIFKPKASKASSKEVYILAASLKGININE